MEIEAKFSISDRATFDELRVVAQLAGLHAGPAVVKQIHDRYLDTADRKLLRGGYACRLRSSPTRRLITVKALTPASGHLHSRAEIEVTLRSDSTEDPTTWPATETRQLIESLSEGRPLELLFEVWQERHVRLLSAPGISAPLIELSLDLVRLGSRDAPGFLELEAELLNAGAQQQLAALAAELQARWRLLPEPRSKFERGLSVTVAD
jgi:inorganic triphosphatase YgiF